MDSSLKKKLLGTSLPFALLMCGAVVVMHLRKPPPGSLSPDDELCMVAVAIFAIFWGPILDLWQQSCRARPPEQRGNCLYTVWIVTTALVLALVGLCLFVF